MVVFCCESFANLLLKPCFFSVVSVGVAAAATGSILTGCSAGFGADDSCGFTVSVA